MISGTDCFEAMLMQFQYVIKSSPKQNAHFTPSCNVTRVVIEIRKRVLSPLHPHTVAWATWHRR